MQEKPQCELVKIRTFWGVYPRILIGGSREKLRDLHFLKQVPQVYLWSQVNLASQILIKSLCFYIFPLYCRCRHHCIVLTLESAAFKFTSKALWKEPE